MAWIFILSLVLGYKYHYHNYSFFFSFFLFNLAGPRWKLLNYCVILVFSVSKWSLIIVVVLVAHIPLERQSTLKVVVLSKQIWSRRWSCPICVMVLARRSSDSTAITAEVVRWVDTKVFDRMQRISLSLHHHMIARHC